MVCARGLVGKAMAHRCWHEHDTKAGEIKIFDGSSGALMAFIGIPLARAIELTRESAGVYSTLKDVYVPAVAASTAALALICGIMDTHSSADGHFQHLPEIIWR